MEEIITDWLNTLIIERYFQLQEVWMRYCSMIIGDLHASL